MLKLIRGNRVELLAEELADSIAGELAGAPIFHAPEIIVPNKGTARYLQLCFTRRHGISGNLRFPFPMAFLQKKVFGMPCLPGESAVLAGTSAVDHTAVRFRLSADSLVWRIRDLLPGCLTRSEFAPLADYLGDDPDGVRLWQLSDALGELYDRYLRQRPVWLCRWQNGQDPESLKKTESEAVRRTACWQKILWQELVRDNPAFQDHFAEAYVRFITGGDVPAFPYPVRLFGFSTLSEPVLRIFGRLAERNTVEFYAAAPCSSYWGGAYDRKHELADLERACFDGGETDLVKLDALKKLFFQNNPLLGAFARVGRDFAIRFELPDGNNPGDAFVEPDDSTLLGAVQNRIYRNSGLEDTSFAGKRCPSIQFHECHSPMREVQALHDFLLSEFDRGELTRNDVIIMTPSYAVYAPLVDAVFNNPAIPYHRRIETSRADLSLETAAKPLAVFLRLLRIHQGKFGAREIFALLNEPEIRQTLHFSHDDLPLCRDWIIRSGIRWGFDPDDRAARTGGTSPESFSELTWRAGFDRLLLAYATERKPDIPYQTDSLGPVFPCSGAEGHQGELLGRLITLVDSLYRLTLDLRRREAEPPRLDDWCRFLTDLADRFFPERSAVRSLLPALLREIRTDAGALRPRVRNMEQDSTITPAVMREILRDRLERTPVQGGFLAGRVTFCSMQPMRNIPAKVICLLGMNHEAFPAVGERPSFDLIALCPERGDHAPRDDQRQMFLEILLAARRTLFISWVGRGIRDNKSRPASTCVEELKRYLIRAFGPDSCVEVQHRLQAFHPDYFTPGTNLFSYSEPDRAAAELVRSGPSRIAGTVRFPVPTPLSGVPERLRELRLNDLLRFFRNPADYLFRTRLSALPYTNDDAILTDDEPFDCNPKENAIRKSDLWQYACEHGGISDADLPVIIARLRADGRLPFDATAQKTLADDIAATAVLYPLLRPEGWEPDILPPRTLEIIVGGLLFRLRLPEISVLKSPTGTRMTGTPIFAGEDGRHLLPLLLFHLAANDSAPVNSFFAVSGKTKKPSVKTLQLADGLTTEKAFRRLFRLYLAGLTRPLPLFSNTSYAFVKGVLDKRTKPDVDPASAARAAWNPPGGGFKDADQFAPWFGTEFPDSHAFRAASLTLFGMLRTVSSKKEKSK